MTEAEKWEKLRQIIREELASCGLKPKARLTFAHGRFMGITDDQMTAWREAYPAVQIEEELKKAAAWILSNPSTAPKSNYSRFLNSWFEKHQNRASIRAIPTDKMLLASGEPKTCAYCEDRAVGTVGHIRHCAAHVYWAMDGKKVA